jgi:hypothetical protein
MEIPVGGSDSGIYSDGCFCKIPLSPFVREGTGKDLRWFQQNSCDKKVCRGTGLPLLQEGGQGGFLTSAYSFQPEQIYDKSYS